MSNFSAFFGAQSDDRQALLSPAEAETPTMIGQRFHPDGDVPQKRWWK
jgi:hypothetical protein